MDNRCAGRTIKGESCNNRVFDGERFCFRHTPKNGNLTPRNISEDEELEGFNSYYDKVDDVQRLPPSAGLALRELKTLTRKKRHAFDNEHLELLNDLRRELRDALENGADESLVLVALHELGACACSKSALKKFVEQES